MSKNRAAATVTASAAVSLQTVAAQANSETGFAYFPADSVSDLVNAGVVECNGAMTDGQGRVATRLTDKGKAELASTGQNTGAASAAVTAAVTKPSFAIITGLKAPEKKRGGGAGRNSVYPFDTMGVGDAFHIPATADKPEPWKTFQSTVTSAMDRFSVPVKDAAGNIVRETANIPARRKKDGTMTMARSETRDKMQRTKRFVVWEAPAGAPQGVGAYVQRTA